MTFIHADSVNPEDLVFHLEKINNYRTRCLDSLDECHLELLGQINIKNTIKKHLEIVNNDYKALKSNKAPQPTASAMTSNSGYVDPSIGPWQDWNLETAAPVPNYVWPASENDPAGFTHFVQTRNGFVVRN